MTPEHRNDDDARARQPICESLMTDKISRFTPCALLCLGASCFAPAASALEGDILNISVGASGMRDSNIFKLPAGTSPAPAQGSTSRSDRVASAFVRLQLDRPVGMQRFQFDITPTATRYDTYSYLDFDAFNYRAAWAWRLTPRFGGTLRAERNESQIPFLDLQNLERNVRRTDAFAFTLDGQVAGGWHVLASLTEDRLKNEKAFYAESDAKTSGVEAGVRYVTGAGNSLTLMRKSRSGDYANRQLDPATLTDNAYREDETELRAEWQPSGSSKFAGRLAHVARQHPNFTERDFSGTAGSLNYIWSPTARLNLAFVARRDIASFWDSASSYRTSDAISFAPSWQPSAKTALRLRIEQTRSTYGGSAVPGVAPSSRRDTLQSAGINLDWTPLRKLQLGVGARNEKRTSNVPGFDMKATILSMNATLTF